MTPAIELVDVGVHFGSYVAVKNVSFSVPRGQFVALVGPTGCGKTSVLNLVAGLLLPASGTVTVSGRPIFGVNRDAAYMFQQDVLLPWKTVTQNVMLGPLLRGMPQSRAREEASRWIDRVGMTDFAVRYPAQLSGGQKKRVAMAQVLINRLPILLMDESFSALDAQTRALMENELLTLWQESQATALFVTHDLGEAIAMADRVILLTAGPSARVKADVAVDLPRPRDVTEARYLPGVGELYERLWSDLREEVMTSYARR